MTRLRSIRWQVTEGQVKITGYGMAAHGRKYRVGSVVVDREMLKKGGAQLEAKMPLFLKEHK
jgi:hypothetical protein